MSVLFPELLMLWLTIIIQVIGFMTNTKMIHKVCKRRLSTLVLGINDEEARRPTRSQRNPHVSRYSPEYDM